jgi:hypothetical protein
MVGQPFRQGEDASRLRKIDKDLIGRTFGHLKQLQTT